MMRRTRLHLIPLVAGAAVIVGVFAAVSGATTAATAPVNTAKPHVSGTPRQGQTLTTTSGSWSGTTPMSFSYRWQRCDTSGNNCNSISGANGQNYLVSRDDVGHKLRSLVTATNSAGSASQQSSTTSTVAGSNPPVNKGRPSISGKAYVGVTLKTSNGSWDGATPMTFAYAWERCDTGGNSCSAISEHSDNQSYTVTSSDQGHTLRVIVTASNGGGSAQATSNATDTVTIGPPVNTGKPQISGSPKPGQTLSVTNGTWTSSPTQFTYAWERCDTAGANCSTISGATTSKYTVTTTDVGHTLRVIVNAVNSVGRENETSSPFGPITTGTPPPVAPGANVIAAANVPATDRLTVTAKYAPRAIAGRGPVIATIKVTDGTHPVSGALVYVLPVPRGWANHPGEIPTGATGTAVVQLTLTPSAPKTGWLLLFVRARTPQGDILAGSSVRRLVQVRITR